MIYGIIFYDWDTVDIILYKFKVHSVLIWYMYILIYDILLPVNYICITGIALSSKHHCPLPKGNTLVETAVEIPLQNQQLILPGELCLFLAVKTHLSTPECSILRGAKMAREKQPLSLEGWLQTLKCHFFLSFPALSESFTWQISIEYLLWAWEYGDQGNQTTNPWSYRIFMLTDLLSDA